jgi:aryl-alcohol dehydrogenase-like predicted oxidoreductase
VLRLLVEGGGSVIDSSPMYGRAEAVVGDLSTEAGLRGKLFLATKVWTSGRDSGIRQMETSLRLMRAERMDLMQVHNLQDVAVHARTLREWKDAGRIRYAGITHYHAGAYAEVERLVKTREWDFAQFNYSRAERDAEQRLLPLCAEAGVAVIVNRPFSTGSLFPRVKGKPLPGWAAEFDCSSWAQFFLKYILSHPAVTCAIPGTRRIAHLEDNLQAGHGRLPDRKTRRRMVEHLGI